MPYTFFQDGLAIYESNGVDFWWIRDVTETGDRMYRLNMAGCKNAETGKPFVGGADVVDISKSRTPHLGFAKGEMPEKHNLNLDADGRLLGFRRAA